MVDTVFTGAADLTLEANNLADDTVALRQQDAAAVQQREQIAIEIGLGLFAKFVANTEYWTRLDGQDQVLVGRWSVPLVRQHGQRVKLDPLLVQLLGLVRRGLAVDRAVLDLAVVHLARLFGKSPPNIIGVPGEMFAARAVARALSPFCVDQ